MREFRLIDIHDLLCTIFKEHTDLNYVSDARKPKFGDKLIDNSKFEVIKCERKM